MFSGLTPVINSLNSSVESIIFQIPVSFQTLLNLSDHFLTFLRRVSSDYGVGLEHCTTSVSGSRASVAAVMFASFACLLYCKKKKRACVNRAVASVTSTEAGESPEPWTEASTVKALINEAPFSGHKGEIIAVSDAKYAEELQVQEALLASLLPTQMGNTASSSMQARPMLNSELMEIAKEAEEPSQSFCEICLENKESWQMFENNRCSHSFCYDCTSKHIVAKIQENVKMVLCPGVNCNATLDFNACRWMIPREVLVCWDETLCNSLILESQKLYCPFRDCSAMLVNDCADCINKIKCPICQRSFCALCCVPWHSDFTCKEYQKLNAKKTGKEEVMVKSLAKKKMWQKCPRCKMYVEKAEGCWHITCRCSYEFCYRCGSKWSGSHSKCRVRT
ncbi:unnamed protein product [Ilex paraguariensis]|uniref:RBR-type E3 ubiquitin transferase n=1 Tax=Ilex paraguariensis TaxID=185542 RepID=A0ABC8SLD2_9AQUA